MMHFIMLICWCLMAIGFFLACLGVRRKDEPYFYAGVTVLLAGLVVMALIVGTWIYVEVRIL